MPGRGYGKVMDALEANKEGMATLEDDDFDFLNQFPPHSSLLVKPDIAYPILEVHPP